MKFILKISLFILVINSHNTKCARVALCTTATGRSAIFVKNLVETTRKNFLPGHQVTIYIFTDQILPIEGDDIITIEWPHKRRPFSNLMRFSAYKSITSELKKFDYIFACNINIYFNDKVSDEVLAKTIGIMQPNYSQYSDIFYGGETAEFIKLITNCSNMIQKDINLESTDAWQDNVHLNYHFLENPPQLILPPSYHLTTNNCISAASSSSKIVVLNEDHATNQLLLNDREFVILIPSYNNIQYYKKNLDSVFCQKYPSYKYRIIYIDDNSVDGTGKAVEEYVCNLGKKSITTIIHNSERQLAMANIYNTIHNYCHDHEIIVMLDGDDELAGEDVLKYLNDIYRKNDTWFTYGNIWFPSLKQLGPWSKKINDPQIELNRFREWDGAATHLRTFYVWLFKKIKKNDLQINGQFFKMTYDVAMFMPMLEMAGFHHLFIEQGLYIYNDQNAISDHRINHQLQTNLDKYIRTALKKYKPLSKLSYFEKIVSNDQSLLLDPIKLSAILDDLVAEILNTYSDKTQSKLILSKIKFLQANLADQLNLLKIANEKGYSFLKNYLSSIEKNTDTNNIKIES